MYSQNNEDHLIKSYFGNFKGHLLSLGENDGITLSNSRRLIEEGWSADLVEPASTPFAKLKKLYGKQIEVAPDEFEYEYQTIKLHNVAVGNANTEMPFYESGALLGQEDTDLVSTLSVNETKRWTGKVAFKESIVKVVTFEKLLESTFLETFDFISIDCEGYDLDILKQMDLNELKCKCVCVEFNGQSEWLYTQHVRQFGFRLLSKNGENLIYIK